MRGGSAPAGGQVPHARVLLQVLYLEGVVRDMNAEAENHKLLIRQLTVSAVRSAWGWWRRWGIAR